MHVFVWYEHGVCVKTVETINVKVAFKLALK